jgi:hypothetical protein
MTQSLTQPVPLISLSAALFLESSAHTNGVNNAFVLLLRRATNKKAAFAYGRTRSKRNSQCVFCGF